MAEKHPLCQMRRCELNALLSALSNSNIAVCNMVMKWCFSSTVISQDLCGSVMEHQRGKKGASAVILIKYVTKEKLVFLSFRGSSRALVISLDLLLQLFAQ